MSDHKDSDKPHKRIVIARLTVNEDGSINYEGDPAAIGEAGESTVRAKARKARRDQRFGKVGPEAMTKLAKMFHSLIDAPGVDPWEPLALLRWAIVGGGASHGEKLAAQFVLSVWNSSTDWEEVARENKIITDPEHHFTRFDLFEAMNVWDQEHIAAMQAWIELPFFP